MTSNKFEEPKLLCRVQSFQNGKFISFERTPQGGRLSLQTGPKRRLFLSASSSRLSKVCKVSMETEVAPIYLPLLWNGFITQSVYANLMIVPIVILRRLNIPLILYLDHTFLIARSQKELIMATDTLIFCYKIWAS